MKENQNEKLVMEFHKHCDLVTTLPILARLDIEVSMEVHGNTITTKLNNALIARLFDAMKYQGINDNNVAITIYGMAHDLNLNPLTASKRNKKFTQQPVYFEANELKEPVSKIRVLGYDLYLDREIDSDDTMSELERKVNSVLSYLSGTGQKINVGSPEVYAIDSDYACKNSERISNLFRIIRPTNIGVVVRATPLEKHTELQDQFMTKDNVLN